MILSASRRTDIPAFYGDWFLESLKKGSLSVRNPFNPKQIRTVVLSPDTVDCIVFWTKNPAPLMPRLPEIDRMGYRYYFQFTLNPYGREIERNLPPKSGLVRIFQRLSRRIGKEKVVWRYDPVLFTSALDPDWHAAQFRILAERLAGFTERCVVSFLDFYRKTERNMAGSGIFPPDGSMTAAVAEAFLRIAGENGLELRSCCETLARYGIPAGACVDPDRIARISGKSLKRGKDAGQRKLCHCAPSVDIGSYNTCPAGCIYCYANAKAAERNIPR